eukprot:3795713-Prorocentrum_lima.AAC.1
MQASARAPWWKPFSRSKRNEHVLGPCALAQAARKGDVSAVFVSQMYDETVGVGSGWRAQRAKRPGIARA